MSLEKVVLDGGPIQALFDAGDKAGVVTALNTPSIKVVTGTGMVSNASMGSALGQAALATFLLVLSRSVKAAKAASDADPTSDDLEANYLVIKSFENRFSTVPEGLDFANDELRAVMASLLSAAGVDSAPYLALGYTLISPAQSVLERDAVLADVDDLIAKIAEKDYGALVSHVVNEIIITATSKTELLTALDDAKTYVEAN